MHYAATLRVVERIPRSHVVVSVVISKYVETRVFIFIKLSTVVNSAAASAATLWVARDRTRLLAFHDGESRDDKQKTATSGYDRLNTGVNNLWERWVGAKQSLKW